MAWSQDDEYVLPMDEKSDGTTESDTDSLFDGNDDNDTDDTEVLSDMTEESDTDDDLSDDEGQRPPEYYLAEVANLDVKRLRQRRYSPRTQEKLDWLKDHFRQ
jgi:hypothetical protein